MPCRRNVSQVACRDNLFTETSFHENWVTLLGSEIVMVSFCCNQVSAVPTADGNGATLGANGLFQHTGQSQFANLFKELLSMAASIAAEVVFGTCKKLAGGVTPQTAARPVDCQFPRWTERNHNSLVG